MNPKPRVLVARRAPQAVLDRLAAHCDLDAVTGDVPLTPAELRERLQGKAGAFITGTERIDAALLDACPELRVVATMSVGYNHIDVPACSAHGVLATNTPDVLTETTADLGFALLMATARRITEAEAFLRSGQWGKWSFTALLGADLHGSTLGILGMGRIGQAIARRARGFGMRVLYHNRSRLAAEVETEVGASYVPFDDLLRSSDHLALVLPYTPASHHLIDATALAKMKPTATLVNIARGGIVDELALADALAHGRLAGAGLDVFEGEPTVRPELLALKNVVLTPHIGSASLATRRAMVQLAVDNLIAALGFGPDAGNPPSLVNADALKAAKTGGAIVGATKTTAAKR